VLGPAGRGGSGPPALTAAVQVVIVAWNSGEHLQRALDSLERQTFGDFEVTLWDNASSDGAVDRLRPASNVRVERCAENLGFAAGVNRAAALSDAPWIATLNPDAFPEPGWLQALLDAAVATGADAVASLQLDDADDQVLDGAGDVFSVAGFAWRGGYGRSRREAPRETVEVFAPCAAAALYRRSTFEALGGLDERYFCYFEDVDLGARLRARGGRTVLTPDAVVRHVGVRIQPHALGLRRVPRHAEPAVDLRQDHPALARAHRRPGAPGGHRLCAGAEPHAGDAAGADARG
jgi:GT2 family glycosyltransferase